jgi:fumarylacetoacetase
MHLPTQIGDYTDFYVGIHHATNIGKLFRPDNPLLPNYKHVPIGYHGRASSVRLSGTNVIRPNGQRLEPGAEAPTFGPCRRLDYELELGIWIAGNNELGEPVPISKAKDRIAGFTLLNDWSARDIQAWEYQPLGPFLAKNFVTSVSPWIITAEAMAPFFRAQPERPGGDPKPLPYLWDEDDQTKGALALDLTVSISTAKMRDAGLLPHKLSHGQASNMYWTAAQMIAHHTSGGCNLQAGDLLGSGTISSAEPGGFGSLMEISSGGKEPVQLPGGETRSFLEDGDDIIMSAHAVAEGARAIGFGECTGRIVPRYGG